MDKKKTGKRDGEVDGEKGAKKEARNTVADMSSIDDGGENNSHKDVGKESGFEMAEDAALGGDGVVTIKSEDDEIREEKIEEDGGIFKMAKGNVGGFPAETGDVGN